VRDAEARFKAQLRQLEESMKKAANASELRVMLARRRIAEEILTCHCQRAGCGAAILDWYVVSTVHVHLMHPIRCRGYLYHWSIMT
jgi:hypothetical protein